MNQPIPKKINSVSCHKMTFNTLLVDGSNLLELCVSAYKQVNIDGKEIGGIVGFFSQLKNLLQKGKFRYCYVFWDGDNGGIQRYSYNVEYKANRDKNYTDENLSDYMKAVNARIKNMENYIYKNKRSKTESDKENFFWQRSIIIQCLDDLYIRQCLMDEIEADDFIAYYVNHKVPEERIVIFSNDRDLTQLIQKSSLDKERDDVIVCIKPQKQDYQFINTRNHTQIMGYNYQNVALKKIICGDTSDNIKGIKGVGEKTLFTNFPQFKERKVTLDEVIEEARLINEKRVQNKQKPLQWANNIVNKVTDGVQGDKIYEINEKIIDLRNPLLSEEAIEMIDSMMYAPLDPEGRSMNNLYKIFVDNNIDNFINEKHFAGFFVDFKILAERFVD